MGGETVGDTYGLEATVDNIQRMQVMQTAGRFCKLHGYFKIRGLRGNRDQAYEAKAVSLGVLRCEVHDVSVNHPFTDDAQWEQLRGDTQHRQDIWVGETPPDHNFLEQTLP